MFKKIATLAAVAFIGTAALGGTGTEASGYKGHGHGFGHHFKSYGYGWNYGHKFYKPIYGYSYHKPHVVWAHGFKKWH